MDQLQQIPAFIIITLIKVAVVLGIYMTTLAYLQWVERKVIAHVQSAYGAVARGSAWLAAASG